MNSQRKYFMNITIGIIFLVNVLLANCFVVWAENTSEEVGSKGKKRDRRPSEIIFIPQDKTPTGKRSKIKSIPHEQTEYFKETIIEGDTDETRVRVRRYDKVRKVAKAPPEVRGIKKAKPLDKSKKRIPGKRIDFDKYIEQ